jgi:hypothetical protein
VSAASARLEAKSANGAAATDAHNVMRKMLSEFFIERLLIFDLKAWYGKRSPTAAAAAPIPAQQSPLPI